MNSLQVVGVRGASVAQDLCPRLLHKVELVKLEAAAAGRRVESLLGGIVCKVDVCLLA